MIHFLGSLSCFITMEETGSEIVLKAILRITQSSSFCTNTETNTAFMKLGEID